jgi:hypothetical protein
VPVLPDVPDAGPPAPQDRWDVYTPIDRPGGRAPHFWLSPGEAAYDRFGKGFTLIDGGAADGAAAIEAAAHKRDVPLTVLRTAAPAEHYRARLTLVRPDQHIAWHGDTADDTEALDIIDNARGA